MKKFFLFFALSFFCAFSFSQEALTQTISDGNGFSKSRTLKSNGVYTESFCTTSEQRVQCAIKSTKLSKADNAKLKAEIISSIEKFNEESSQKASSSNSKNSISESRQLAKML